MIYFLRRWHGQLVGQSHTRPVWGWLLIILLVSCGTPSAARPTRAPSPTRTPAPRQPTAIPRGYIGQDTIGDAWPLTIPSGVIVCSRSSILLRTPDDRLYAVNGTAQARAAAEGWRDIRDLSIDTGNGTIKSLQPLLDLGTTLCR